MSKARDRTQQVLICHSILPAISGIFIILRIWSRAIYMKSKCGLDDLFMFLGYLNALIMDITICIQTRYGLGKDVAVLVAETPWVVTKFLKLMYAVPLLYVTTVLLIKTGILLFYLRINPDQKFRTACLSLIALNASIYIACFFPGAFGCKPIALFWDNTLTGKCIALNKLYLANAIMNITMDIIILALPIPMIWLSPSLRLRTKLQVTLLFILGSVVCVASIIRIPTLFGPNVDKNVTQSSVDSHRWTMIELHLAIVTASIPAIKPLISGAIANLVGSTRSTAQPTSGSRPVEIREGSGGWRGHTYSGTRDRKRKPTDDSILLQTVDDTGGSVNNMRGEEGAVPWSSTQSVNTITPNLNDLER